MKIDFSRTYDVLVVGGGNAGLCAAMTAREAGASVLLLEFEGHAPTRSGDPESEPKESTPDSSVLLLRLRRGVCARSFSLRAELPQARIRVRAALVVQGRGMSTPVADGDASPSSRPRDKDHRTRRHHRASRR